MCALTGSGGGYAEFALAEEDAVIPLPHDMSLKLGAAYPLQVLTAWGVLNISGRALPGEWVLVHAAAGGVGADALPAGARQGLPGDRHGGQR